MTAPELCQTTELVLLSGGVDSAVLLWRAREPVALFVDYGQPSKAEELAAASALALARPCPLVVTSCSLDIGTMGAPPGEEGPRVIGGRNLVLIALGVNAAVSTRRSVVWIGAQAGDAANYPDCRLDFIAALDRINKAAYGVGVSAPLAMSSRASVAAEYRTRVPQGVAWSCYAPKASGVPCGTCDSCRQER